MSTSKKYLLDCTLRDGGYINGWEFGEFNIKRIINSLIESKTDIIECGYLSEKRGSLSKDFSMYRSIQQVEELIKQMNVEEKAIYTVMINFGEVELTELRDASIIQGIRLAFHKNDYREAILQARILVSKGYKVFIQPMVTNYYSDEEILELLSLVNKLDVYAFYIVDSFGSMRKEDVTRLTSLINHNLKSEILLGFHAHNNLQLAFSNAIEFINNSTRRDVIIDSSIFGMGRGAGNLTTELFANYLSNYTNQKYDVEPLLDAIDNCISIEYERNRWGYSIAYYLSAVNNCHPNYSSYLINKKTLTIPMIEKVLKKIEASKKISYDEKYIEELYLTTNSIKQDNSFIKSLSELNIDHVDKALILAPGKSVMSNFSTINDYLSHTLSFSVNYVNESIQTEYYFFSNQKRFKDFLLRKEQGLYSNQVFRIIITSNLTISSSQLRYFKDVYVIDYLDYLGETNLGKDNAAIILLKMLISKKMKCVYLAGLDGYESNGSYLSGDMEFAFPSQLIDEKNSAIRREMSLIQQQIELVFITESKYLIN